MRRLPLLLCLLATLPSAEPLDRLLEDLQAGSITAATLVEALGMDAQLAAGQWLPGHPGREAVRDRLVARLSGPWAAGRRLFDIGRLRLERQILEFPLVPGEEFGLDRRGFARAPLEAVLDLPADLPDGARLQVGFGPVNVQGGPRLRSGERLWEGSLFAPELRWSASGTAAGP